MDYETGYQEIEAQIDFSLLKWYSPAPLSGTPPVFLSFFLSLKLGLGFSRSVNGLRN
jgi:hypothetical protein